MIDFAMCKRCKHCTYVDTGKKNTTGYYCTHEELKSYAKKYEEYNRKIIMKPFDFVGTKYLKTALRWCPINHRGDFDYYVT